MATAGNPTTRYNFPPYKQILKTFLLTEVSERIISARNAISWATVRVFQAVTKTCQKTTTWVQWVWQHMVHTKKKKQFYGLRYFIINNTLTNGHKEPVVETVPPELSLINKPSTIRWERYLKTKSHNKRTQKWATKLKASQTWLPRRCCETINLQNLELPTSPRGFNTHTRHFLS